MPAEGKVVFWSLSAEGIVGNGGFQYLFERWSLPSAYAEAVAGFRAIGADECADALAEVLEWFPKGVPPADRDRRLRRWRRRPGWPGEYPIADRFRQGSERGPALLATYIRARREAFERMLSPPEPAPGRLEAEPLDGGQGQQGNATPHA